MKRVDRAVPMIAIELYHEIGVFRQIRAVDSVHSLSVCGTLRVDGRLKVHFRYAARIVVVVNAVQLGQRATVCFVHVVQGVIWSPDLIHLREDFPELIMFEDQPSSLRGLPNVIRNICVALRVSLVKGLLFREKCS